MRQQKTNKVQGTGFYSPKPPNERRYTQRVRCGTDPGRRSKASIFRDQTGLESRSRGTPILGSARSPPPGGMNKVLIILLDLISSQDHVFPEEDELLFVLQACEEDRIEECRVEGGHRCQDRQPIRTASQGTFAEPNKPSSASPRNKSSSEKTVSRELPGGSSSVAKTAKSFSFRELATATKNFRSDCLLGEGGFGRVYKGQLENGQIVAVKQLDLNGFQGNREFLVEVLMLSLLSHPNLVSLVGYCADGDQRLLVYEYMALGSLADHLLDNTPDQVPLGWHIRMKIAHGTAKGLEYLHEKANPPVIYRDLKSPNILIDEDYNPKLSDFGLAKLGPVEGKTHISTRVMGTYGYCAPEYIRTGQLTVKTDVYSFGVFLLELITGRRAVDTSRPPSDQILVNWAKPMLKDRKRYHELVDPLLRGDYPEKDLSQAVGVAAMCLQEEASVRPFMSDAVVALGFLAEVPAGYERNPGTVPQKKNVEHRSLPSSSKQDKSTYDRQKAVAEAIEWGSLRQKQKAQSQGIVSPPEDNRL